MRILVNGACGRMGNELLKLISQGYEGSELAGGADIFSNDEKITKTLDEFDGQADVLIDFSHFSQTRTVVDYAIKRKMSLVIATTGQSEEDLKYIQAGAKEIPIFFSANMSLGVALLVDLAKKTAAAFPDADIEIVETHHNRKVDAPSGTALMIAAGLKEVRPQAHFNLGRSGHGKRDKDEIGISSIRMGNIVGEHEVLVSTDTQTISLKHQAHSRALFAEGALTAAKYLIGKTPGFYTMKDLI